MAIFLKLGSVDKTCQGQESFLWVCVSLPVFLPMYVTSELIRGADLTTLAPESTVYLLNMSSPDNSGEFQCS